MKNWLPLVLILIYLIDPFKLGYISGYLLFTFLAINLPETFLKLDKLGFLTLIFSIVYALFYSFGKEPGFQFTFIYALFPTTFYTLGKFLYNKEVNLFQKSRGLFLIAVFFSLTALISVNVAIIENGFIILNRNVNNFWTGFEENATYTGGFLLLNMCIPAILLISWKKTNTLYKSLLIIIYLLSIVSVLRLGSRTQLVISIFSIFVSIIYLVARQSSKKNLVFVTTIFIITNLIFGYFSLEKDSKLISAYTDRMESKKYGTNTAGGRTERWEKSIEYLFDRPLGWDLDDFGYSHNLWFDVLRVGGIISFVLLLLFSFISFKILYKSIKNNKVIDPFLGTMLVYIVSFNLLFLVEPIFEGYFEVFALYCFYTGILSAHFKKTNTTEVEQKNTPILRTKL